MKTRKHFILAAVASVLVAGLLAQATMPDAQDQSDICIQEAFPNGKITDRHAFFAGAVFAQQEINEMRYKEILDAPRERKDILGGLKGVQVLVEGVNPEVEKYGLAQTLLQTDTELRLRQHGIRILTDDEALQQHAYRLIEQAEGSFETLKAKALSLLESLADKDSDEHFLQCLRDVIRHSEQQRSSSPSPPYLYVNVCAIVSEESHRAAFSIQVKLNEGARLSRNGAFCQAPIWEKGGVAGCSSSDLKDYARECLRDYLDEFINDYLAANPKDRSPEETQ